MCDILFRLVLGHLFGDYLLQTNWMAKNKKVKALPLIVHCTVYTLVISLFLPELPIYCLLLIFESHIILDGTHIIDKWLHLIDSRSIKTMKQDFLELKSCSYIANNELMRYSTIVITWFVQIVADNTIHLALMYLIIKAFQLVA